MKVPFSCSWNLPLCSRSWLWSICGWNVALSMESSSGVTCLRLDFFSSTIWTDDKECGQREMLRTLERVPWAVVPHMLHHIALYDHYTINIGGICWYILGGGFKDFLCSPLFGEMIQLHSYFSNGLKPPTSISRVLFEVYPIYPFDVGETD